jgi:hypothetical protein
MAGLLVFTSCKKEKATTTEIEVVIPGMTCADEGERAYIDQDWNFSWLAGDQIMVYNLDTPAENGTTASVCGVYHNTTGQAPRAKFSGPSLGKKMDEDYRYFYPVNIIQQDEATAAQNMINLGNENRQTFYVRPVQQFNDFDAPGHPASKVDVASMPMSIDTKNLKASARLLQIFGVADIQLRAGSQDVVVDSIKLIDNVYNLWGNCSLKLHMVDTTELRQLLNEFKLGVAMQNMTTFADHFASYVIGDLGWTSQPGVCPGYPAAADDEAMRTLTLNCRHMVDGEEVGVTINSTNANNTDFCFLVRPMAMAHGFKVLVYLHDRENPVEINDWIADDPMLGMGRAVTPGKYKMYQAQNPLQ